MASFSEMSSKKMASKTSLVWNEPHFFSFCELDGIHSGIDSGDELLLTHSFSTFILQGRNALLNLSDVLQVMLVENLKYTLPFE